MLASSKRERVWRAITLPALLVIVISALWVRGVGMEWKMSRVAAGMTSHEVESLLGSPNNLPDLRRNRAAFWDANTLAGCRYVSIGVFYDAEGKVASIKTTAFWRRPLWLPQPWPWP